MVRGNGDRVTSNPTNGAVIFDMDGLIVDSVPLHYRATVLVLREHSGVELPKQQWPTYMGYRSDEVWQHLIDDYSLAHSIEQL